MKIRRLKVPRHRAGRLSVLLVWTFFSGALLTGCQTRLPAGRYAIPFDAQKVARLSHEACQATWNAGWSADTDLRYASFRVTAMDQEAMYYLYRIYREMPWIALEIEKHPDTPRVSSMRTWNLVAYHAKLFRLRYNPMNYKEPARAKIEVLLRLLDEIAPYYSIEQKPPGSGS